MTVLKDLVGRLDSPPFNRDSFDQRHSASLSVAHGMPLVHVCEIKWLEPVITTAPHEFPTSRDGGTTRQAELALGVKPSVYFYAGRACPSFGDAAFAFPPGIEVTRSGAVTPFDTGGMVSDKKHVRVNLSPTDGQIERRQYCLESQLDLATWRAALAEFLAAYFDQDVDYWLEPPRHPDQCGRHRLNLDWRAWTFEVRLESSPSIHERVAWCGSQPTLARMRTQHLRGPLVVANVEASPLGRFWLSGPAPLQYSVDSDFCQRLEYWIREQVGVS